MAVYTGSSVGSLTLVTNDNNSGGVVASKVVFNASVGTTYAIAVDGAGGLVGNLVLNWVQPAKPVFTLQPQSQFALVGNNVALTSAAVGVPSPGYQWRKNGTDIGGATSSNYALNNVQTNDAANYTVVATNTSGSTTSVVATLTVYPSATATLDQTAVSGSEFRFRVAGVTNLNYIVQANTNIGTANWVSLATNPSPFVFTNVITTNHPQRFFRAVYQP